MKRPLLSNYDSKNDCDIEGFAKAVRQYNDYLTNKLIQSENRNKDEYDLAVILEEHTGDLEEALGINQDLDEEWADEYHEVPMSKLALISILAILIIVPGVLIFGSKIKSVIYNSYATGYVTDGFIDNDK